MISKLKSVGVESTTIHERISALIDHFSKGNKTAFGRETDILPGVLASITGGRLSKPSFELLQKLILRFPNINGDWLVMGRGQMLREEGKLPDIASLPMTQEEAKAILHEHVLNYIKSESFLKLIGSVAQPQAK